MSTTPEPAAHIVALSPDPALRQCLSQALGEVDYRVTAGSFADSSLEQLLAWEPDLVILDYMWTALDNNWSTLHLLRLDPLASQIPILLCTGAVTEAQALTAHLREQRVRVLLKPYTLASLLAAVADLLTGAVLPPHALVPA